jgi:hypothetical protein
MVGWIRNIVIIFAILSAVYAVLTVTANIRQRQKLRSDYHGEKEIETKEAFVERGLRQYNRSIRPKMLLGIYFIPLGIMILLIWLAQYG